MFKNESVLSPLYERLIRYGITTLGSCEVLRFLGQKTPIQGGVHGNFKGEVTTDLRQRPEGIRIKHRVNKNSIKMYNKQGSVLRVETTMNHTREFKVFRRPEKTPRSTKPSWQKLRKGVADIKRRVAISDACNERYLASLSTLSNASPLGDITSSVSKAVSWKKTKVRALNTFQKDDAALLHAVSKGQFTLLGFRNKDLRTLLFNATKNPELLKTQRGKVTRRLRLLRAHGLIAKVSRTHRYLLTDKGRLLCTALDAAGRANTEQLLKIAA